MRQHSIRQRNDDFLDRVPLEEFVEELVRAIRHEVHQGLHLVQTQERKTMATVAETQQAITRYQAAVDAREMSEEAKISDLEHAVVPDSLVQSLNDAAAKIEAQNTAAPATVDGAV